VSGDKEAYAFAVQQPGKQPRWQLHPKCAQNPAFPALFAAWTAAVPTAVAARTNAATNRTNAGAQTPSRDHYVFPWEAEMSDIEWAVATVLKAKYPDIHQEIIWAACNHGGLLPDDADATEPVETNTQEPQNQ